MKNNLFACLLLIAVTPATFAQNYSKRLKGVEKELNQVLEECKAAGFSVAVVSKDEIIYEKGFGYRDYENKVPVDKNTLFAIGSCTKAFTSSVLGILREKDELSFDDRPSEYVSDLEFFNEEMNRMITIKDLMCHRTGLPRHDFSWYFFPTHSKDELIKRIEFHEPFTGVRKHWYYNNFMFLLQGVIAERITGESWEDNVQKHIFNPLGMTRSNLTIDGLKRGENTALGYSNDAEDNIQLEDYYDIAAMGPAGSINSSAHDMAQWLKLWINKGKFGESQVLSETYVNEAISSQMIMSPSLPDADFPDMHFGTYGYGWMLQSYKGHYQVEHGGNIDGFSASTLFYPSDSIGIVVLANQNGSSVPTLVGRILSDRLLNLESSDWLEVYQEHMNSMKEASEQMTETEEEEELNTTAHPLENFVGDYNHPGYGSFSILLSNDSLYAKLPNEKLWLRNTHYDVFEPYSIEDGVIDTTESAGPHFNFVTSNSGKISAAKIEIEPQVDAIEFKHTPKTIDVDSNSLQKYVGKYELMGAEISVYIKNDILYTLVPGQPEYELMATEPNIFVFKIDDGFSLEFFEKDGEVNEVMIKQPNGSFKAVRK